MEITSNRLCNSKYLRPELLLFNPFKNVILIYFGAEAELSYFVF